MELKLASRSCIGNLSYLLIVPYGIETCMEDIYYDFEIAFNRTLWN